MPGHRSKQEEVGGWWGRWGVGGQQKGSGAVRSVMLGGGLSPQLSLVAALLSWFRVRGQGKCHTEIT